MSNEIDPKKLRILCTRCVRIARVHFVLPMLSCQSAAVVTECCTRRYGHIEHDVLSDRPQDLTTNDMKLHDRSMLEEQLVASEGYIAQHQELARWVRFVLAGDVHG
jgi:aconitase B